MDEKSKTPLERFLTPGMAETPEDVRRLMLEVITGANSANNMPRSDLGVGLINFVPGVRDTEIFRAIQHLISSRPEGHETMITLLPTKHGGALLATYIPLRRG